MYIEFNPRQGSFGELLGPAMEITDKENAQEYLEKYAQWAAQKFGTTVEEARETCRENIGYCAGYHSEEVYNRVMDLFDARHPVFGTTLPSPEEAFVMGQEAASDAKSSCEKIAE